MLRQTHTKTMVHLKTRLLIKAVWFCTRSESGDGFMQLGCTNVSGHTSACAHTDMASHGRHFPGYHELCQLVVLREIHPAFCWCEEAELPFTGKRETPLIIGSGQKNSQVSALMTFGRTNITYTIQYNITYTISIVGKAVVKCSRAAFPQM